MRRTSLRSVAALCIALQFAQMGLGLPWLRPALAQERHSQMPDIQKGWEYWNDGNYRDAIQILRNVLKTNPTLIAQSSLSLGDESASQEAFCQILKTERSWVPDATIFTPAEREVFAKAKATCKLPGGSLMSKPWVWGVGLLAVGGIAAASGGHSSGGGGGAPGGATALPQPPVPPQDRN